MILLAKWPRRCVRNPYKGIGTATARMTKPTIIGLVGHQGVGKNYIAETILPRVLPTQNTVVLAFADHFKVEAIAKWGADYTKVFGKKDYATRKLLQTTGTEEGRHRFGDDIWIRTLGAWMEVLHQRGVQRFVISDVRFENEAQWILERGGMLVKIEAPKRYAARVDQESGGDETKKAAIRNHVSEAYVDRIDLQHVTVHNDPVDDVETQLRTFFCGHSP